MRGRRDPQVSMLAFVHLGERMPARHPLRTIKTVADGALVGLSVRVAAYAWGEELEKIKAETAR